jgi:hypothetical protein
MPIYLATAVAIIEADIEADDMTHARHKLTTIIGNALRAVPRDHVSVVDWQFKDMHQAQPKTTEEE